MTRRRGITLLELLITITITAMLWIAASRAYVVGVQYQERLVKGNDQEHARVAFEDRLRVILSHAYVSPTATDTSTYFTTNAQSGTTMQTADNGAASTLTFTTTGVRVRGVVMDSQDDFETQNQKYGPQGGVTEYSISTTAAGQPTSDKTGLYLRGQTPADGDATQGGSESLFYQNVTSIQFEFWDGNQWLTSWDSTTDQPRRIPAAVRVSYQIEGEKDPRMIIVRIPLSDVTYLNPITTGGA